MKHSEAVNALVNAVRDRSIEASLPLPIFEALKVVDSAEPDDDLVDDGAALKRITELQDLVTNLTAECDRQREQGGRAVAEAVVEAFSAEGADATALTWGTLSIDGIREQIQGIVKYNVDAALHRASTTLDAASAAGIDATDEAAAHLNALSAVLDQKIQVDTAPPTMPADVNARGSPSSDTFRGEATSFPGGRSKD